MPFRNCNRRLLRQPPEDPGLAGSLDGIAQHFIVPATRYAIQSHTRKSQFRIEQFKSEHYCGNASCTLRRIDHKYYWKLQQFGDLRTAATLRVAALAVEQTHHAFRDDHVRTLRRVP